MRSIILGSGSKGNSSLIMDNKTNILIDVGFSYPKTKMLLEQYNIKPEDIDAILITHTHKDHVGGLKSFIKKYHTPVYANFELKKELGKIIDEEGIVLVGDKFNINHLNIETIFTSHDAVGSVGFIIDNNRTSLVYVTDTGFLNQENLSKLINKNIYIFESNHDIEMLWSGPYPYILKQRIVSDYGHLSNEMCSNYLDMLIGDKTKKIVLAHLSETNNCPEKAYNQTNNFLGDKLLGKELLIASQDSSIDLGDIDD